PACSATARRSAWKHWQPMALPPGDDPGCAWYADAKSTLYVGAAAASDHLRVVQGRHQCHAADNIAEQCGQYESTQVAGERGVAGDDGVERLHRSGHDVRE